jgi:hypothetical protein
MHRSRPILDSRIPLRSEKRAKVENSKKKDLFERKVEDPSFGFCVEEPSHWWEQGSQEFLITTNWSIWMGYSTVGSDWGKCTLVMRSLHFAKYPLHLVDAAVIGGQDTLKE